MAKKLNRKQWDETADPIPMVEHLADRECTMDFTQLIDVFLIRVWRELSDPVFRQVLDEWFDTGQTAVTQDEANTAAEKRVKELKKQLKKLKPKSSEHSKALRQIELGKSLLCFLGSGFEETVTEVCDGMANVAKDPAKERRWQADTIRALFDFDYTPPAD